MDRANEAFGEAAMEAAPKAVVAGNATKDEMISHSGTPLIEMSRVSFRLSEIQTCP